MIFFTNNDRVRKDIQACRLLSDNGHTIMAIEGGYILVDGKTYEGFVEAARDLYPNKITEIE